MASASDDRTVKLWDADAGQELKTVIGHAFEFNVSSSAGKAIRKLRGHGMGIHAIAFSPDGKGLASSSADRTVRIWDPIFGQEVLVLRGHASTVTAVALSPDGARLASAGTDQTVRIWEAERTQGRVVLATPRN